MKLRLAFAALLFACTSGSVAFAQQAWIDDPEIGEGEGLPLGNLDFHPSVAGEFGYDSNYLRRGENDLDAAGNQLPSTEILRLRITPSLSISTRENVGHGQTELPIARFRLNSNLNATYSIFIPLDDTDEFDDRNRLGFGVGGQFELFPQRPVTWDADAAIQRTIDPSSLATGDLDFDRYTLGLGTGITWRPGGGLFDWRVGYGWRGVFFSEGNEVDVLNNGVHTVSTRGRYRWLPHTSALFEAKYRVLRYSDDGATQTLSDGEKIESQLGVAGLITKRFAFRVLGGWAASFFKERNNIPPQNYDGPIANAELRWYIAGQRDEGGGTGVHSSSVAIGYEHKYEHSYLGPFYTLDRGYLTFRYFLGQKFVTALTGYVAYIAYPDFVTFSTDTTVMPPQTQFETHTDFHETRVGASLFGEYRVATNVGINATLAYDRNISDNFVDLNPGVDQSRDGFEYSRFQAFAGARLFW